MKRSEFVPGVLIHLPGESFFVHLYKDLGDNTLGISEWGYKTKDGRLVEFTLGHPSYGKFWHLELNRAGFRLWQVTGHEYLYSKTIPFSALRKVDIPSPATNPVTI